MAKSSMRKKLQPHQRSFICFSLVSILLILLPFIYYRPSYEELSEKEITVKNVGYITQRHGSPTYFLTTVDGERLEIRGELSYQELQEELQPNTQVMVKYHRGLYFLWMTDYIKELTCNGKQLVTYSGTDQIESQIIFFIMGLLVFLIGLLLYIFSTKSIKKRLKKLTLRQNKLKEKYGDNYHDPNQK